MRKVPPQKSDKIGGVYCKMIYWKIVLKKTFTRRLKQDKLFTLLLRSLSHPLINRRVLISGYKRMCLYTRNIPGNRWYYFMYFIDDKFKQINIDYYTNYHIHICALQQQKRRVFFEICFYKDLNTSRTITKLRMVVSHVLISEVYSR